MYKNIYKQNFKKIITSKRLATYVCFRAETARNSVTLQKNVLNKTQTFFNLEGVAIFAPPFVLDIYGIFRSSDTEFYMQ